jgi:proteasome lid subunit RPN8/RPN11
LRLTPEAADEILRAAREAAPEECCGIVLADVSEPSLGREVLVSPNAAPAGARASSYALVAAVHLRAAREESAGGRLILGYFHSHPGGEALPSRVDAELACPGVTYLVVSVSRPARMRAYRLGEGGLEVEPVHLEESSHGEESRSFENRVRPEAPAV